MRRTITRDQSKLSIALGGIEFSEKPYSTSVTTITFKTGPNIPGTGLHWHEKHTEYLQVLQGYALVTVGSKTAVFSKDSGVITIPRYTIHSYMRADATDEGKEGVDTDLVVREWTEPADGDKEIFFRNIFCLLMDRVDTARGNLTLLFSIIVVAWAHDNYPVFWRGPSYLGGWAQARIMRLITYTLMWSISFAGLVVGFKPEYPEYTPARKPAAL
jgi:hypothetical protein